MFEVVNERSSDRSVVLNCDKSKVVMLVGCSVYKSLLDHMDESASLDLHVELVALDCPGASN